MCWGTLVGMLLSLVKVTLAVYLGFGALLYVGQRSMIYFPTPEVRHDLDTEEFDNDGYRVSTIVLNPSRPGAILYFGGNAEAVAQNAASFSELFRNHTVYMVHYRGYGGSDGKPSEMAIYSDALAVYDAIRPRHSSISVIGRSLGGGVATYLAAERQLDRLVLVTPFDSAENVARQQFPLFPMRLLLKDRYDSLSRAPGISVPTLVLVAQDDEVIASARTDNLIAALDPALTAVHRFPGAGHNTISFAPGYEAMLEDFLSDAGEQDAGER